LFPQLTRIGAVAVEPIDWSKATAAKKIFEGLKKAMPPDVEYTSPIDFLMVIGDGRDDEVIFRWANDLEKDRTVTNVTTVSLGSRNTEAGYTLTQGVTGKSPSKFHARHPLTMGRSLNSSSEASYAIHVVTFDGPGLTPVVSSFILRKQRWFSAPLFVSLCNLHEFSFQATNGMDCNS
jgi:hypothetical protein